MAKYNYDKKALRGLGVGDFLNEVKVREQHIAAGENKIPTSVYNPNRLAEQLHPHVQFGRVEKVIEHKDARTYVIAPNEEMGCTSLAYFRAGQYISFEITPGEAYMCKPYSLCSNPGNALGEKDNRYEITVKRTTNGWASDYILDNWKEGTATVMSGPLGEFYYERLRDARHVIAVAGGSGITPFLAMARAIAAGIEDFNLTILYGSRDSASILLKEELAECEAAAGGKVKVIHVLSGKKEKGYKYGFITADLIRKNAPKEPYSIFVCGPRAMYRFLEEEIARLELPRRLVRYELSGEYGDPTGDAAYPSETAGKEFSVKVWIRGESQNVVCKSEESLLHAMEAAGIKAPSDCRSGQCGWCHSRLIGGDVYIPESADGRRAGDKKFGWIHPCVSYPLSDVELEVFPLCK